MADPKGKFKCYHCGWCCKVSKYSSAEEFGLAQKALEKLGIELSGKRLPNSYIQWSKPCPAYSKQKKKCLIYELRPYPCRAFLCGKQGANDKRPWRLNGDYNKDYLDWLLKNNKDFYQIKEQVENKAAEWANRHGWSLTRIY